MSVQKFKITPIVLAGGKGTRLWPLSRASRPKQFLPLTGSLSLFQQTLMRFVNNLKFNAPIVVTNEDYRFLVAEQAFECGVKLDAILLEPDTRNTTPATLVSCLLAKKDNPDQLVLVLPSDHDIAVNKAYLEAIDTAAISARKGKLVTFGITPTHPSTGFGYIEAGKEEPDGARSVKKFVEKPNAAKAKKMFETNRFYWNSGMFVFTTDIFLNECKRLAPKVYKACKGSIKKAKSDLDFIRLDAEEFSKSPNISIDYAIFEKTKLASVVHAKIKWSDLGSWNAVWDAGKKDQQSNLHRGPTSLNNTTRSLIVSEKLHVCVNGLDDVAVIASEDAIFVGRLSRSDEMGNIVQSLKEKQDTAHLTEIHQTSYRPWGGYSLILVGKQFQVKRLFVNPGKKLSLQKHFHRAEHWIVVRGTADVQIEGTDQVLHENQSTYIPPGAIHRLGNSGKIQLELIEVQTGTYLGEDDIIRLEDEFGRK